MRLAKHMKWEKITFTRRAMRTSEIAIRIWKRICSRTTKLKTYKIRTTELQTYKFRTTKLQTYKFRTTKLQTYKMRTTCVQQKYKSTKKVQNA